MMRRDITPRQFGERSTIDRIESECQECGGSIASEGCERVCTGCGLVVDADWIDHGYGRMNFADPDRDRVQTLRGGSRVSLRRGAGTRIRLNAIAARRDRWGLGCDPSKAIPGPQERGALTGE